MQGNTFGRAFRVTAAGESYGVALTAIVDGVPPGIKITKRMIQDELDKRRPGQSKLDSPRKETDQCEIISGVREGNLTSGAPVTIVIYNVDTQEKHVNQYREVKDLIRPGHAEITFQMKYGSYADWCGAGRASGRETTGRVMGGAVAKQILKREGIDVLAHAVELHGIKSDTVLSYDDIKKNYRKNEINCCDDARAQQMIEEIIKIKKDGDTAGGVIEVIVHGLPGGLGEPVFDKINATIAHALFSIGAVKGVEFGVGFKCAQMTGSEFNDIMQFNDNGTLYFKSNNAGGTLGGISTGQDLRIRVAVKPTPTVSIAQDTVNTHDWKNTKLEAITRRDPTLIPRIQPVAEAMVRIAVLDALYMTYGYDHFCRIDDKFKKVRFGVTTEEK